MLKTKATGFEFLRHQFKQKYREKENDFLAKLTPEEIKIYETALPITWMDLDMLTRIFEIGAGVLYASHPDPILEFAREEARFALRGIYRILIKFATVSVLVQQTAKLWNLYYDKGKARPEKDPDQRLARLIVEDFPDLPLNNRKIVLGYTIGTLELTGARNIRGEMDDRNPNQWVWTFRWE